MSSILMIGNFTFPSGSCPEITGLSMIKGDDAPYSLYTSNPGQPTVARKILHPTFRTCNLLALNKYYIITLTDRVVFKHKITLCEYVYKLQHTDQCKIEFELLFGHSVMIVTSGESITFLDISRPNNIVQLVEHKSIWQFGEFDQEIKIFKTKTQLFVQYTSRLFAEGGYKNSVIVYSGFVHTKTFQNSFLQYVSDDFIVVKHGYGYGKTSYFDSKLNYCGSIFHTFCGVNDENVIVETGTTDAIDVIIMKRFEGSGGDFD
jgi:hypothetical protein